MEHRSDFLSDELIDEFDMQGPQRCWESVFANVVGAEPPPPWAADELIEGGDPGPVPFRLLLENSDETCPHSIRQLIREHLPNSRDAVIEAGSAALAQIILATDRLSARKRGSSPAFDDFSVLLETEDESIKVNAALSVLAAQLGSVANQLFHQLFPRAARLECTVTHPLRWLSNSPLTWRAVVAEEKFVGLSDLSSAEARWARFSIQLADLKVSAEADSRIIAILDEPERALHRRAETDIVDRLVELCEQNELQLVVASHSPAFLSHPECELHHVYRDSGGYTEVDQVPRSVVERTVELGLNPSDLLQLTRVLLLVEGQHELVILNELIGDRLAELGVQLLCMRGATSLKAWDAQLIERYTDVPFVVLVDNDNAERLRNIWTRSIEAAASGRDFMPIIDELRSGAKGSEGDFTRELCKNLITGGNAERYHITAFETGDITEYLHPADFSQVPRDKDWATLRREAGSKAERSGDFKKWMREIYTADYSDSSLRTAAQQMDEIPEEFTHLLRTLEELAFGQTGRENTATGDLIE